MSGTRPVESTEPDHRGCKATLQTALGFVRTLDSPGGHPYAVAAMAQVQPEDCVDVPQAARRSARYACEFDLRSVATPGPAPAVSQPANSDLQARSPLSVEPEPQPLQRLADSVQSLHAVRCELAFSLDDQARPVISGHAEAEIELPCHRCLEAQSMTLRAEIGSLFWLGADPPPEWQHQALDVFCSNQANATLGALVEDDLLLALPVQVCTVTDCPSAPEFAYPAAQVQSAGADASAAGMVGESPEEELPADRQRPFADLRNLIDESAEKKNPRKP